MDEKEMLLLQNIGSLDKIRDLNNQLLLMLENEHAKNVQRKQALEVVEWVSPDDDLYCPWCGNYKTFRHDPNCLRQLAIED